jgi:uncharacterized protein (TIGR02246 family)
MNHDELAVLRDESQIRNLIRAYNRALDDRRSDLLAELFAEDGLIRAMGSTTTGREAIRSMIAETGTSGERPHTAHHTTNTLVTLEGDSATAESDFMVLRRGTAGTEIMLAGRYRDRLVRGSDGWRFSERHAVALGRPQG